MPMLASERVSSPGIGGGSTGFSTNSVMRWFASTAITPKALASLRGTAMHPTVQSRPLATWSASISA